MWPRPANFISVGPVTRTRSASFLVRNGVDIQRLAGPSDFLGLASVMPVGLADVNIKHLALAFFSSRVLPNRLNRTLGQREHCAFKKWSSGLDTMNNSGFCTQPSCHWWESEGESAINLNTGVLGGDRQLLSVSGETEVVIGNVIIDQYRSDTSISQSYLDIFPNTLSPSQAVIHCTITTLTLLCNGNQCSARQFRSLLVLYRSRNAGGSRGCYQSLQKED